MQPAAEPTPITSILAACEGAYSIRTTKGYAADLRIFADWCTSRNAPWLPADPKVLADFVDDQVVYHRISTIKRRLCAIAFAHRMCDLSAPTDTNVVRLAVRRATRKKVSRPSQVRGLTHDIRAAIVAACPDTLEGLRDATLISIGYDTLCRSSELSAMHVGHVTFPGNGAVLIPRSKSDSAGEGRFAYLSPETTHLLSRWLDITGLTSGPLFRSLHLSRLHDGHLATSSSAPHAAPTSTQRSPQASRATPCASAPPRTCSLPASIRSPSCRRAGGSRQILCFGMWRMRLRVSCTNADGSVWLNLRPVRNLRSV